ncbi:glycosyltransferase family 4 protein [Clostridium sp. D2Q-14]|uniref:glycosyltransferase family 4 protein n=1 Tax=Anaeromonas gelatinilytica TaxID=2683194 RepID=UPI00193B6822|nr:glycosyltransferase family 4 protein [Anaeromonas gelatinilytica]MBS4536697.1 glycosyltransferase family 4 protein [Anaeromonas gelatinilytica]
MCRTGLNVGIMGESLRPPVQQKMVYGYDIAVNELLDSILEYSKASTISCLVEPQQFQQNMIKRKSRKIQFKSNVEKEISMISEYDLIFSQECRDNLNVDVLHNVSNEFIELVSLREALGQHIPVTFTIHCASYQELLKNFFYPMITLPLKSYDTLICTSEAVFQTAEKILEKTETVTKTKQNIKLVKIPLGINTDKFKPMEKEPLREKYGLSNDEFVILWLGRFSACDKADLYPLLHVFSNLVRKNKDKKLKLVLAGYQDERFDYIGALEKSVENLDIEEEVVFMKNHSIQTRNELYSMSDVFTSPIDNVQETFGITPIEAMACGIPQVVSDWDGYRDTVDDGVTGYRIPTYWLKCDEDINNFGMLPSNNDRRHQMHHYLLGQSVVVDLVKYEEAFQNLIDDNELLKNMRLESRKRALKNYSWEVIIDQYDKLWKNKIALAKKSNEEFDVEKLYLPDYFNNFSNYATKTITEESKFTITKVGDLFRNKDIPKSYDSDGLVYNYELFKCILIHLNESDKSIIELCQLQIDFSNDEIKRTLMKLWKYGMVTKI